jgi:hypothetical protein
MCRVASVNNHAPRGFDGEKIDPIEENKRWILKSILFFVFLTVALTSKTTWAGDQNHTEEGQNTSTAQPLLDQKLLEHAKEAIRLYGNQIPIEAQKSILQQKITVGMSPYEARLAGGAFSYKVEADPKNWPKNTDPRKVMWKQSTNPDDSKIWMTFQNVTQFPGEGKKRFTVFFIHGKAVEINKLGENK